MNIFGTEDALDAVLEFIKKYTEEAPPKGMTKYVVGLYERDYGGTDPIQTFPFTLDEDREGVARDVIAQCVATAEEIGTGSVSFTVRMVGVARARRTFSLSFEDNEEDDGEEGDDPAFGGARGRSRDEFGERFVGKPNERGLITQAMRHQEQTMQLAARGQADILKTYKDLLKQAAEREASLVERIRVYEREHMRNLEVMETLLTATHARDLEIRAQEKSEHRKDQVAQSLIAAAPVGVKTIVEKFLGSSVPMPTPGGHATHLESMISGFMSSLTPEQIALITQPNSPLFNPAQQLALAEVMSEVHNLQERTQEEVHKNFTPENSAIPPAGPHVNGAHGKNPIS